ncbi:hypothetical protein G6L37_05855 [Agrobacterium rubi]|nr:hypothetical protein [Agrobacterium rubi]NTF24884.1 hypothetical protein [Agrobacterium rubi]
MARKIRGYAAPGYDLGEALRALSRNRPRRVENKLVMVPSLSFMGRWQPEDVMEDSISYRNPHEFLEWVFPDDAPKDLYPFTSEPVFGFTCGARADVRYLEIEAMFSEAHEIFYDELGFDEPGTRSATRATFKDLYYKLGDHKPLVVRLLGDDDFAEVTQEYFSSTIGSSERFLWSYAANFRKLVFPLLGVRSGEPGDLRRVASNLAGGRGRLLNALSQRDEFGIKTVKEAVARPGYLAMLYALSAACQNDRDAVYDGMMDPARCERITVGDRLVDGIWCGSGREKPKQFRDAADHVVALVATGMLIADEDEGILEISAKGRRLMEVLPDVCDDADWALRLFEQDCSIPSSRSQIADDWIMTFFGAIANSQIVSHVEAEGGV